MATRNLQTPQKDAQITEKPVTLMTDEDRENYTNLIKDLELKQRVSELQRDIMMNNFRYYEAMSAMAQLFAPAPVEESETE